MKKRRCKILQALILSGLCFSSVFGQESDSVRVIDLESIQVNALAVPKSKFEFPGAIGTISKAQLQQADQTNVTGEMNKISGVFMHSGAMNTNRITIRGVGSRTPFATNKIRAFYGNLPLTDGGGETAIEDIDLALLHGIEIQKGPNASNFGAGLGGVIQLAPAQDSSSGFWISTGVGSFGLIRTGVGLRSSFKNQQFNFSTTRQHSDGYRENNALDRANYLLDWKRKGERSDLGITFLYTAQKAAIPSSLGETDYQNEPTKAAFTWGQSRGYEDYYRAYLGVQGTRQFSDAYRVEYALYGFGRENYEPRPFNILDEEVIGSGGRVKGIWDIKDWEIGWLFESLSDIYRGKVFENLYQDFTDAGSVQGDQLEARKESRFFWNYALNARRPIGEKTTLEAGVNLNRTSYRFNDETKKAYGLIASPRLSMTHQWTTDLMLYGTVSHGFTPPSLEETLNEDGSFNQDIQPETGWNQEVGFKGNFQKINFSLSAYSMDIRNLLVTRRTADDVEFGLNAGSTRHNGLEADAEVLIFSGGKNQIRFQSALSLNDYKFKEFEDDGEDFSGNQLTGVPKEQFSMSLSQTSRLVFSKIEFLHVGKMPITDGNDLYSDAYKLLNLTIGVQKQFDKLSLNLMARCNNLFDEKYTSMLNINAQAFGGGEPRYYYPGLPRNWQVAFLLNYRL